MLNGIFLIIINQIYKIEQVDKYDKFSSDSIYHNFDIIFGSDQTHKTQKTSKWKITRH